MLMKRTPLKRKTPLKAKTGLKRQRQIDRPCDGAQWSEAELRELAKRDAPLKINTLKRTRMKRKAPPGANSKIRQSAKGKPCLVRIPSVCNFNPETTVAAHIRIAGTCGTGIKPSDLLTVRACLSCHDEIDRRTRHIEDLNLLALYVHEGHCRTLVEYEREGLIQQARHHTTPHKIEESL